MKKIIIGIVLSFVSLTPCWSATALYFTSSNEVILISQSDSDFAEYLINPDLSVITGATYPDGYVARGADSQLRIIGYSKIVDGTVVRNATQAEIDTFQPIMENAKKQKEEDIAKNYFQNDPRLRRILIAFADILKSEINILRAEHGLPDRTLQQFKTAILNRINKDD